MDNVFLIDEIIATCQRFLLDDDTYEPNCIDIGGEILAEEILALIQKYKEEN